MEMARRLLSPSAVVCRRCNMAPLRPQQYRISWPLTPKGVEDIDTMFETLFKALRGASVAASAAPVSAVPTVDLSRVLGAVPRMPVVEAEPGRPGVPGVRGAAGAAGTSGVGAPGPPGRPGQDGVDMFSGAMGALNTKSSSTGGGIKMAQILTRVMLRN